VLGAKGGPCPAGKAQVTRGRCEAAAAQVRLDNNAPKGTSLGVITGSWSYIPNGCMMTTGGKYAWMTWFNVHPNGNNAGDWNSVCEDKGAFPHVQAVLANGNSSTSAGACNATAAASPPESRCEQAAHMARPKDKGLSPHAMTAGSWAHVPKGCSLQRPHTCKLKPGTAECSHGEGRAYYNRHPTGAGNPDHTNVCELKTSAAQYNDTANPNIGSWIRLNFKDTRAVHGMWYRNRDVGHGSFNSKLRLEFSDGTSAVVALTAYSIKASEYLEFPAVATSHVKVCVCARARARVACWPRAVYVHIHWS